VLSAHEGSIPCLKQELGVDERSKQRSALRRVESPESPCLRFSQPQTRHFQKLTLDAPKHFFIGSDGLWRHHMTSCFLIVSSEILRSNACTRRRFRETGRKPGQSFPGRLSRRSTDDAACRKTHQSVGKRLPTGASGELETDGEP